MIYSTSLLANHSVVFTHLTHTGSLLGCFKAVDKSTRVKWVVLNEYNPLYAD